MTKFIDTASHAGLGFNPVAALVDGLLHTGATLYTWQQRSRERAAMNNLDDRLLMDVGLDRADVEQEVRKPFWRG